MYPYYNQYQPVNQFYREVPYSHPYPQQFSYWDRQPFTRGQATWTEGGRVTQCGIPWSHNEYMTAAVGVNSPYQCGQSLKVRELSTQNQREMIVTIVDKVPGYPADKINLHRKAFEALGADPAVGVINIEFEASPELAEIEWGKYLLEVTQVAYPNYNVSDYNFVERTNPAPNQTREVYHYTLQSPQERIKIQGTVIYNPNTNRVISFDIKET
ncbi:DUF3889 domain-containing protein [Paraliobacillus sediminis]|uniref:DUF3889 domain-containing protein n=1 Tax=Paraliobacillus sediminis TaxID=1885916 RepID=UPI000E3D9273|nr:DUF3889 domain-containing protein [Paraliobacillus sediminis]